MNFPAQAGSAPVGSLGRTLKGRICSPIQHQDQSEDLNTERLLRRIAAITQEIYHLGEEQRLILIQAAYYTPKTSRGKRCSAVGKRLEQKIFQLQQERKTVHTLLLQRSEGVSQPPNAFSVGEASNHRSVPLNYYEISWVSRILRLAQESDTITLEDIQVALPDRAFRGGSFLRILDTIDFLGLTLQMDAPDKFSLSHLLAYIRQKPEPTAEQSSAALEVLLAKEAQLHQASTRTTTQLTERTRDALVQEINTIRQEIIESHLRIVLTMCASYIGKGLDLADLFQEGCRGLMAAIGHFDPDQGTTFRNYATFWIRQSLGRAIADNGRLIRLPVYILDRIARIAPKSSDGVQTAEDEPFVEAQHGLNGETSLLARIATPELSSIEDEDEAALYQAMAPPQESHKTDDLAQVQKHLLSAIDTLKPREREVIKQRFGLNGSQVRTLEEIGAAYHVTRERIRQIEAKALRKLRHPSRAEQLTKL